jgi:hypothetical protein
MHRLIMLSNAYQQSSAFQSAAAAVDPDNKLLWRYERHRGEAEVIRDSMLFVSGRLNTKMGGPGVFPPMPQSIGNTMRYGGWRTEKDPLENDRRSVYVFVKRNMTYPMFEAFDGPTLEETCARRFRTVIPSQALTLMNEELVLDWSRSLAARLLNDGSLLPDQQVERAYRLVLSRAPNAEEREAALKFLNEQTTYLNERFARKEKVPVPANLPQGVDPGRAAAMVDFCHVLMNSNEFMYMN